MPERLGSAHRGALPRRLSAHPAGRRAVNQQIQSAASAVIAAPNGASSPSDPATHLHRLGHYYVGHLGPDPAYFIVPDHRPPQRPLPFK